MAVYKNSRMDSLFYEDADLGRECEVKLDEESIVVSYKGDNGWINYSGRNDGSGHFELRADANDGRASLHMFPGSQTLEGYWVEQGFRGMWRIELA